MSTTSITITDEAYQFLKSIKGKMSFSQTILSLRQNPQNILQYAGMFKELDLGDIERVRTQSNKDWASRS